ncbi:iron chaperone [Kribbia dieselivorans]|uniref:iron chaperone n=1 Tax=Kribbia dieselivorans TaxID=331526 RepID=UPI0008385F36|nr:hypothetical protein [Kribbia dieselivorans]
MSTKDTDAGTEPSDGFSAEERAAMKQRAEELKKTKKGKNTEAEVLEAIAAMPDDDRVLAERLHATIMATAPHLAPRTWYGFPAYAKDGKVLCFYQPASKFKARYGTLGFQDVAALDDGVMWPTSFAIIDWNADVEAKIVELVRVAAS